MNDNETPAGATTQGRLYVDALSIIMDTDAQRKARSTRLLAQQWRDGALTADLNDAPVRLIESPGRPERPVLVYPQDVPRRSMSTPEGHGAMIHAIAHIEFNAINLAWDAVYRFRDLPRAYIDDWIRVADEEAYHFQLLCQRLSDLGYEYGDFAAHNGLWDMACQTSHDPLDRMALVPRVLEARGLDATPKIVRRLRAIGDYETVDLLENVIMRDEIGHVEIGSRWFRYLCAERGLDSQAVFIDLIKRYLKGALRGPFNQAARRLAGFSQDEMAQMEQLASGV